LVVFVVDQVVCEEFYGDIDLVYAVAGSVDFAVSAASEAGSQDVSAADYFASSSVIEIHCGSGSVLGRQGLVGEHWGVVVVVCSLLSCPLIAKLEKLSATMLDELKIKLRYAFFQQAIGCDTDAIRVPHPGFRLGW